MKLASWRFTSPLLAGALALLPAVAAADEFHFETFRFGQRAMGMGGAVTAYADEPEASYYNPAGLAMLSGTRFSGALNFVGLDRRVLTDGLRAGSLLTPQDLESSDFLPIPGSSVLTTDFGNGRHVLGLATFLHSDSEERFSGARTQTQDGSFASARTSVERRREDEIGLRGLVYGFRVSRDFAVGGALLLASQERTEVNRRAEVLQRRSTGDSVFVDASTREDTTTHSLLARIGVLWRPSEQWSYGLACSSPSLTLLGEADLSYTRIVSGDPDAGERPLLIDQRATPDAVTVLPAHCRGGLAWRVPEKLVLTFDLSAHFPTGYDRFELTNGLEARAAQLGERVEGDLTVNAGLGVEWRPSPRVPLRMGVFTNRTQAPEIAAQPKELGPPHVDLYGVTLSGGYLGDDRSINLGAELQVGEGHDALPSDLNSLIEDRDFRRIDRQEWRVVFFVSGAVAFVKKQATEVMEAWK